MSSGEHHYTISAGERLITIGVNAPSNGQTITGSVGIKTAGKADWEYRTVQLDKYQVTGDAEPWKSATMSDSGDTKSKRFNIHINSYTRPIYTGILLRAKNPADAPIAAKITVEGPLFTLNDTIEEFKKRFAKGLASGAQFQAPSYSDQPPQSAIIGDVFRTQAAAAADTSLLPVTSIVTPAPVAATVPAAVVPAATVPVVVAVPAAKVATSKAPAAAGYNAMTLIAFAGVVGLVTYFFAHKKDRKKNLAKLKSATSASLKRLKRGKGSWYGGNRLERAVNKL